MKRTSFGRSKLAMPLSICALAVSSAWAAPTVGPSDASFYTLPAQAPTGQHGDLISYRPATVNLGAGAPATKAWNVLYQSANSDGEANVVSGTVLVPTAAWSGTGPRPVILYAVGTQGLAQDCAPSRQLAKGTEYENANIAAALKAGYAVLVSDYAGYLNGAASTYLAGASQGHAVLDMFKAAQGIPSVGISPDAQSAVWGFSQGGQTAGWAGEIAASYTPGLKLTAVAAGGVPADFLAAAPYLNGSIGFAFLGSAINGLGEEYPNAIPINLIANDAGKAALAKIKTECVFKALFEFQNKDIASYTNNNLPLDSLLNINSVRQVLTAQTLGLGKVSVPLYQYHGQADEFIPLDMGIKLKKQYCAKFSNVTFDLYPSEHIVTQFQAAPTVLSWLGDRFAGKPAQGTCNTTAPDPVSTANPGGGNFVVSLKEWPLTAKVVLKTLNQTVNMPAASSFTAQADVTAKQLNGSLNIPDFKQKINIIGLPIDVGLKITPAGPTTGTVSVDDLGIVHVHGKATVNITVSSVLGIPFGECKTVTPVEFPLDFDGPVSSLGNGGLTFSGTTTFPQIKGCFISGILSSLMSGAGQAYTFAVAPPAPVKY